MATEAPQSELIYRLYILEPRYSDELLQIAYSKRFSVNHEFLGIEKFDVIGRIKIIYYLVQFFYFFYPKLFI